MAKTVEELIATGSVQELGVALTERGKRCEVLGALKSMTAEQFTESETLLAEIEQIEAKYTELKKVEDVKANLKRRGAAAKTPVGGIPHSTGTQDSDGKVEFPLTGVLKHFRGPDKQKSMESAWRFGQFLGAAIYNRGSAKKWCADNGVELKYFADNLKAQQDEGTPADGGVLVPIEFERTLIDLREQYGTFRANAKNEPMGSETKFISRRTAGLTAYFTGEGAAIATSSKSWDTIQLVTKKLACLVPYSTEVAEDAWINMADDLAGEIAYAFALKEDNCGWLGDGTSTYGGITGVIKKLLNLSATIANIAGIRVQATVSTGTFASATLADFQATLGLLPKYADTPRCKWYMHKTFYHTVPGALVAAAGGNQVVWLAQGVSQNQFLGYPVEFCQVLPSAWVANQIFAIFGDLSLAAAFGDRRATTLFTDPYSLSAQDQVQIRGTERFDIIVHDVGNQSATASARVAGPLVAFASAAS